MPRFSEAVIRAAEDAAKGELAECEDKYTRQQAKQIAGVILQAIEPFVYERAEPLVMPPEEFELVKRVKAFIDSVRDLPGVIVATQPVLCACAGFRGLHHPSCPNWKQDERAASR